MSASWVVVADGGRARILEIGGSRQELREIDDLVHGQAGRTARSSGGDLLTVDEDESEVFASHVADHLDKARSQSRFGELCLIAAPRYLAMFRACLSAATAKLVGQEIPRDLLRFDIDDIDAYVRGDRA